MSRPLATASLALDPVADFNRQAKLALARLSSVSGLVPSVDWLPYGAVRKEALLIAYSGASWPPEDDDPSATNA